MSNSEIIAVSFISPNLLESLRCFWVGERGSHLCPSAAMQLIDAWGVAFYLSR